MAEIPIVLVVAPALTVPVITPEVDSERPMAEKEPDVTTQVKVP